MRVSSGDDIQKDADDDDEEKKKFKPEDYDWFEVTEVPRTFPQFFTEMHPAECSTHEYTDSNIDDVKREFYRIHKDMEEGRDDYFYLEFCSSNQTE